MKYSHPTLVTGQGFSTRVQKPSELVPIPFQPLPTNARASSGNSPTGILSVGPFNRASGNHHTGIGFRC